MILREARRKPDPEKDGTATWSLKTLCQALRKALDGVPEVSEDTIRSGPTCCRPYRRWYLSPGHGKIPILA